jgi:DNA replication protein DnaC
LKKRNAPYLVLDDFGTENATPWAREKLFQIIDYRYVAQLPTIITIARSGSEIEPRIQTRIFDLARSSVNEILAPSFRTTHRRAQARPENNLRKPRTK